MPRLLAAPSSRADWLFGLIVIGESALSFAAKARLGVGTPKQAATALALGVLGGGAVSFTASAWLRALWSAAICGFGAHRWRRAAAGARLQPTIVAAAAALMCFVNLLKAVVGVRSRSQSRAAQWDMIERARDQAVGSFDSGAVGCAADQVADFERMEIPWDKWRFCDANAQYAVCGTYPASALVVPASVSDDDVREVARFRKIGRLPVLSYYHAGTGASLSRAAQPMAGMAGMQRNEKDEELLRAIYENNTSSAPSINQNLDRAELRIVDCRSLMAALGNQVGRGGGVESRYHGYATSTIEHRDMPNIHAVSSAFAQLREHYNSPLPGRRQGQGIAKPDLYRQAERYIYKGEPTTQWLSYIANIIATSVSVAEGIAETGPHPRTPARFNRRGCRSKR